MPFVEQEEGYEEKIVEGKTVKVYKPRVEVTIKHLKQAENICLIKRQRTI
mgnify:CR=1 FL=1